MALTELAPMLAANDLSETMDFYATLGFACQGTFEADGKLVWCSLERDGIRLMFTWDAPHTHDDGTVRLIGEAQMLIGMGVSLEHFVSSTVSWVRAAIEFDKWLVEQLGLEEEINEAEKPEDEE